MTEKSGLVSVHMSWGLARAPGDKHLSVNAVREAATWPRVRVRRGLGTYPQGSRPPLAAVPGGRGREVTGVAVSLGGGGSRRVGTQEAAWQPESRRAEPPHWLMEGPGTLARVLSLEAEGPASVGGALQETGQRRPHHLNPGLGEGDDSILRPPPASLSLTVQEGRKAVSPRVGRRRPLRCP